MTRCRTFYHYTALLCFSIIALTANVASADGVKDWEAHAAEVRAKIDSLIKQLGHDDYFVRERAQGDLAELSFEAFDSLTAALSHEDFEIAYRARILLRSIKVKWTDSNQTALVQEFLNGFEHLTPQSKTFRSAAGGGPRGLRRFPWGLPSD